MTPTRREGLRMMIEAAKRNHAKRSHLQEQLTWATVEQLRFEMAEEARSFWPTPIVAAALFIGIGCLVLSMIGV